MQDFSSEQSFEADWSAKKIKDDGSEVEIYFQGKNQGTLNWSLIGEHNINNALAAIAAVRHVGVTCNDAIEALASFKNVKRRMELKEKINGINVYDDFAHHPTAIATTLGGLRAKVANKRILAVVDPRSNTMKMGVHKDTLINSVKQADLTIFHCPLGFDWQLDLSEQQQLSSLDSVDKIVEQLVQFAQPDDTILIMSNGGFGGIHEKLIKALKQKWES